VSNIFRTTIRVPRQLAKLAVTYPLAVVLAAVYLAATFLAGVFFAQLTAGITLLSRAAFDHAAFVADHPVILVPAVLQGIAIALFVRSRS
jgi:hypothetical protein